MNKLFWFPLGILAAIALYCCIAYYAGDKPNAPLSRKQEKAVTARIAKQEKAAADSVAQGDGALKAADRQHAAANNLRQQALTIHRQSRAHATPPPTTDTAYTRLQKLFASYGDRPAPNLH